MEKEEKLLLFKDLSARLSYHVRVKVWLKDGTTEEGALDLEHNYGDVLRDAFYYKEIVDIKPYIRPMSSMTEEEEIKLYQIAGFYYLSNNELLKDEWRQFSSALSENKLFLPYPIWGDDLQKVFDWLNAHHFDYRGLIERGLALEAPEDMYNLNKE